MALLIFILILIALILVHELGHFIVAKLCGIRVDEFGIFFPPRLFAVRFGETEYSFNLLPFGGFVKIFGENGEEPEQSTGPSQQPSDSAGASQPGSASASRSFAHKPKWQQALVVVAGIASNLLAAWLILAAGYMHGIPTSVVHDGIGQVQNPHVTIIGVLPNSPADKAGLKENDTIVSVITGTARIKDAANAQEVQNFIAAHQNESIGFSVKRNGTEVGAIAVPTEGITAGRKAVGIELADVGLLKLSLPEALVQAAVLGKQLTVTTAGGLVGFFARVFHGNANFAEVSGPIGIAGLGSTAVHEGFVSTILLTALISINLAVLNIIPIPGLDGGKLLFIAIEAITKRPISQRLSLTLTFVGLGLLVLLMLVVSYHDVARLVQPA